jgi:hypothetical protein
VFGVHAAQGSYLGQQGWISCGGLLRRGLRFDPGHRLQRLVYAVLQRGPMVAALQAKENLPWAGCLGKAGQRLGHLAEALPRHLHAAERIRNCSVVACTHHNKTRAKLRQNGQYHFAHGLFIHCVIAAFRQR